MRPFARTLGLVVGLASLSAAPSSPSAQPALRPELSGYVPLTSYRAFLLTARDVPAVFEDARLIQPTTAQVSMEQTAWRRLDRLLEPAGAGRWRLRRLGQPSEQLIYEWQTIAAERDTRRRDDLLSLFLRPERQIEGVEDVFLFAKTSVDNRDPRFAAHELVPVYKQHLQLAAANAASHLWLSVRLASLDYDFQAKAIRVQTGGAAVGQNRSPSTDAVDLLAPIVQSDIESRLPPRASATANYSSLGSVFAMREADAAPAKADSPTVTWRNFFQIGSSQDAFPMVEWLAFDRQLRMPSAIPMDAKAAEGFVKRRPELSARIYFDAERVELSEQNLDRKTTRTSAVLFAKVRAITVRDAEGQVLVSHSAAALPTPVARQSAAPTPVAPSKVPTETQAERIKRISDETSKRIEEFSAAARERSEQQAKLVHCSIQAASKTADVTGNLEQEAREKHPAYQKILTACMAAK
jgi:hypothetical protein